APQLRDPRSVARSLIATADGLSLRVLLGGLSANAAEEALRGALDRAVGCRALTTSKQLASAGTRPSAPISPDDSNRGRASPVSGRQDTALRPGWRYRAGRAATRVPSTRSTQARRSARGWSGAPTPPATPTTSSSPRTGAGRPVSAPALSAYAHERGDLGGQSSILVVATRQPDLTDCRAL